MTNVSQHAVILAQARELLSTGRLDEATALYQRVLSENGNQVEALNGMALSAANMGNLRRCIGLLEKAAELAPADPVTLTALAKAYQSNGDSLLAVERYQAALVVEPTLFTARLALANLHETSGDPERALPLYFRAIVDAQKQGRWLSDDSTPPRMRPLVRHALNAVRVGRRGLLERVLAPSIQQFGRSELGRVEECLSIYLGESNPHYPDPRQQPTFLYFPGLGATPYLDKEAVPELVQLEQSWAVLRDELEAVLPSPSGSEAVFRDKAVENANLVGTRGTPAWNGYYFDRYGEPRDDNRLRCPATSAALDALPLCRIRQHAPETLFSVLSPGTHLLPHRGVTNTRVVGHLALIVPDDCALRVADQQYSWREGESVLFDDTYMHEAWNRSSSTRVVLIFDLWHPGLTGPERSALTDLVGSIGDFRVAADLPVDGRAS